MKKIGSEAQVPPPLLAGHTPGPWQATPSEPVEGYECFWITATPASNQEREVATVSGPQNARNTANARLIAAAPEMLAALKTVGACIADHALDDDELWSAYNQVIAAIAKAKGKAR